uniref:Interleukin 17a/f3 n=1 Tax=Cynoglossus semilaevis TaxID=244447 RepID=A0A3P8VMR8_CYNSE
YLLTTLLMLSLAAPLHAAQNERDYYVSMSGRRAASTGRMVKLELDSSFGVRPRSQMDSSIPSRSLSPWTYRETWVESRLPQRISQAQCLSTFCLNLRGKGEDAVLEAKPIQHQMLVLHKRSKRKGSKADKKYVFRLGTEVVTVGCTCVRPNVLQQE